jgi:hypothetical protein
MTKDLKDGLPPIDINAKLAIARRVSAASAASTGSTGADQFQVAIDAPACQTAA